MKKITILSLFSVLFATLSFASHPHQAICSIASTYTNGDPIQFMLQEETAREYVNGDPNLDVHDFRYQVRVCDDDNDYPSCSTYESKEITHNPGDQVTLVGMKNKDAVFFDGKFNADGTMEGNIVQMVEQNDKYVKILVPFKVKLENCLHQSWVELKSEADSLAF